MVAGLSRINLRVVGSLSHYNTLDEDASPSCPKGPQHRCSRLVPEGRTSSSSQSTPSSAREHWTSEQGKAHQSAKEGPSWHRECVQREHEPSPAQGVSDPSARGVLDPVFANRTAPIKKPTAKKRAGATATKKFEQLLSKGHELDPEEATAFRALSARANYLAQDRPDIAFCSKELCREFAIPNKNSFIKLKRLVRYLCGLP